MSEPKDRSVTPSLGTEEGSGTASGKVIILGEHAVVHGCAAIAVSLGRGARARVRPLHQADSANTKEGVAHGDRITLSDQSVQGGEALLDALRAARAVFALGPVELELSLDLPAGSGLGASAALGGATARALAQLVGLTPHDPLVAQATDAWEEVFHGNASGVDRAAALGEGALLFIRGQAPIPLALRVPLQLVIAVAGPPASTKTMVESVMRLRQSNRIQFDKNLAALGALVDNAKICLRTGDLSSLGQLINLAQMVLAGWMLSTDSIELACRTARSAGALGAKLTGAGGGGCIVALSPSDAMSAKIESALSEQGFDTFSTEVGASPQATCEHHDHHE